jgi:hypothetical protein
MDKAKITKEPNVPRGESADLLPIRPAGAPISREGFREREFHPGISRRATVAGNHWPSPARAATREWALVDAGQQTIGIEPGQLNLTGAGWVDLVGHKAKLERDVQILPELAADLVSRPLWRQPVFIVSVGLGILAVGALVIILALR